MALLPFSFFIFAAQEPLLTILKRVGLHLLGSSDAARLAVYFGSAILTVAIVVAVGAAVRRYLPTPYAWLAGGAAAGEPAARRSDRRGMTPPRPRTSSGSPPWPRWERRPRPDPPAAPPISRPRPDPPAAPDRSAAPAGLRRGS